MLSADPPEHFEVYQEEKSTGVTTFLVDKRDGTMKETGRSKQGTAQTDQLKETTCTVKRFQVPR
jgi:hypothetical protein